jgi:hypothetical protein
MLIIHPPWQYHSNTIFCSFHFWGPVYYFRYVEVISSYRVLRTPDTGHKKLTESCGGTERNRFGIITYFYLRG